jgi:hypothetical protein
MAYATPRTWVAGDVLTAAQLNQDIRDNVGFLANPPACRIYHNADQSIPHNVATTILAFNSERYDTDTMHDTVTNNSRITFTTAGLYVVTLNVAIGASNDNIMVLAGIRLGGTTLIAQQITTTQAQTDEHYYVSVATIYKFTAAQYVEATVRHKGTLAAAKNVMALGNSSPEFAATRIGIG